MLAMVKGVSRNRNISELGIDSRVCTYANWDSELHCLIYVLWLGVYVIFTSDSFPGPIIASLPKAKHNHVSSCAYHVLLVCGIAKCCTCL